MAAPSPEELRREFLLDPEIAFLNHGSFGACPRVVFESYQTWQHELEHEPVDFLARRLPDLLDAARSTLASYLGCAALDLAFVQNATTGVNLAARSLALGPDDEVLSTALEYGACDLAWEWACRRAGAHYVRAPIPLPLSDPSEVVGALFARANERTRVVYVSHVTSTTGLVLPVEEIVASRPGAGPRHGRRRRARACPGAARPRRARRRLLRGERAQVARRAEGRRLPARAARAPGPSRRRHRQLGLHRRDSFSERIEIQGTRDPAAWLAVPDAIRFQAERDWDAVRDRSRRLTRSARRELCELVGTEPLAPESMLAQMAAVRLPRPAPDLSGRLFARHRVEIPVGGEEEDVLRLSVAAYTTRAEIDRLLAALVRELDAEHRQDDE